MHWRTRAIRRRGTGFATEPARSAISLLRARPAPPAASRRPVRVEPVLRPEKRLQVRRPHAVAVKPRPHTAMISAQLPRNGRTRPVVIPASSTNLHNAFTMRICSIVLQRISNNFGLATSTASDCAREIATFNLLREKRNSRLRGRSSPLDVAIEKKTTGASCPWNLSTVPIRRPVGQPAEEKSIDLQRPLCRYT